MRGGLALLDKTYSALAFAFCASSIEEIISLMINMTFKSYDLYVIMSLYEMDC